MSHRLRIDDVSCEITPLRTRARVQLSKAGLAHVGLASGPTTESSWHQVVAQATINAVRMFTTFAGANDKVSLVNVRMVTTEEPPVVIVAMTMGTGPDVRVLSGSAPLAEDPYRAVAKAVLDGLNRHLELVHS